MLAEVLARRGNHAPTGSYLETRCVQVLRDACIAPFERQVPIDDTDGHIGTVDLHREGVVIELVGARWHLERFSPDHHRYNRLTTAGYRLLTLTFDEVEHQTDFVATAVAEALARARGRAA